MKILGLTGDIASGKSTVAAMLQKRGAQILDADLLVRELYSDATFAQEVQALFESEIRDEAGTVDRKKLSAIVFQNSKALAQLENLVHPAVAELRDAKLKLLRDKGQTRVVVLEAVKLIESGQAKGCDEVWCVVSSINIQLQRLMETRGLNQSEAQMRLASQPSRDEKKAQLEYSAPNVPLIFIENNATIAELESAVEEQWQRFLASHLTKA